MHHPTDRITHTTAFVTPVVEHWLCASSARENENGQLPRELSSNQSCLRTSVPERKLTSSSMWQGEHKWIMVYQDHLTKFCILRPLTSKRASEVAYQLLDIYLLVGIGGSPFHTTKWQQVRIHSAGYHRVEADVAWQCHSSWEAETPTESGFSGKSQLWHKRLVDCMDEWQWHTGLDCWTQVCAISKELEPSHWNQAFSLCCSVWCRCEGRIDIVQPPQRCHCKVANWRRPLVCSISSKPSRAIQRGSRNRTSLTHLCTSGGN